MQPGRLAEIYSGVARDAPKPHNALEESIASALSKARASWPLVELDVETFVRRLARRQPEDADPLEWLASCQAPDLYLACACANGDPQAIAAFDAQYLALVPEVLARQRVSKELATR